MAECNHDEECAYTPRTLMPTPLPEACECPGGGEGGSGDGHKYTFKATATGFQVFEDGKLVYTYKDKNDNTTYTWQTTTEGWVVKDNTGKVIFTYTDKSGENTTYTFEQKGVDFDVKDNNGKVVFNYKGTTDTNTTYTWSNYKDGFKVTDDKGVVAYTYDPNLGKNSDGSYAIDTLLSTVFKGHTTISTGQITGFDPANLVVGETLVYDGVGSVGVITKDNGNGTYQVTTMTISPGTRQGVRLGSVETAADLPATCADAEAKGWQTPQLGDFAYVTTGGQGDEISEYVITSDTDCNLTWTFSHSFNAGDYQAQSTTAMAGMILTGGAVQGTFGTPIDPKTLIRGVMRNGILLTPDAQGKVNVIVDDSHIIVNALPTTNIVDKAEYIVIDANQKVTGTWVHDATGWYQTYAVVNPVAAHQIVKDLPTTDINDEVEYVQVGDLDDPVNTFVATWIHTDNGWVKTGESVKAQKAHIAVTALPTTNINENAEYLVMTDTTDPDTLIGTWVRVNGNWVQTEKVENGYHLVTALPTTDIDDKSHYVVVGDLAQPDTTFLGEFVYDKTASKWIDLKGSTEVTYHIGRDGQQLDSWFGRFKEQTFTTTNYQTMLVEERSKGTGEVISFDSATNTFTFKGGQSGRRFEILAEIASREGTSTNGPNFYYMLRDSATGDTICQTQNVLSNNAPAYNSGGTMIGQFDVPAGTTLTADLYGGNGTAGATFRMRSDHTNIAIKEIGRIVDPIAYMLNDGNAQEMPVGSLLQVMSNSAPKHYLICDGSEYAIGTYPELEAHFVKEFGAVDHFGGTSGKWKVPDLRGEFLRMTGTNSRVNQGSGAAVGTHQNATQHKLLITDLSKKAVQFVEPSSSNSWNSVVHADSQLSGKRFLQILPASLNGPSTDGSKYAYTARPTNTSVNVAIKCESTPRVIVDQGTYKASVKCSVPAAPSSGSAQFRFDGSDIIGDTTMVDTTTNEFVAPVDGLYVVGCQTTTSGTGAVSNYLSINGANTCWGRGINPMGTVYLKTGDRVSLNMYGGSSAQTGRANIALVNTVEKNIAEVMLKPNTWAVGVEQNFGDGVYGYRVQIASLTTTPATGSGKATALLQVLPASLKAKHVLDWGGTYLNSNDYFWSIPGSYTGGEHILYISNHAGVPNGNDEWSITITETTPGTMRNFDIWVLYTKD